MGGISESLSLDCLRITNDHMVFYGGDQAWFGSTIGQYGGCGTVAAADITAYLALRHSVLRKLYNQKSMDQGCFLNHMNTMYHWVKPWKIPLVNENSPPWRSFGWTFGVWPMGKLLRGVERYASARGVRITGRKISSRRPKEELVAFIRESMGRDCPVAMLIGRKPRYEREVVTRPDGGCWVQTHFSMHWVVVAALAETGEMTKVKVATWGGTVWLDLDEWHEAGSLMAGLVSFVWSE